MKNKIYRQRCFEAGTRNLSVAITKVRNHEGTYVYMIDSSEPLPALTALNLPVFDTWQEVWGTLKEKYPEWHSYRPYFIHPDVNKMVLSDLKEAIRKKAIENREQWRKDIRRFWLGALKSDREIL